MYDLGLRLREVRLQRGLTQKGLAKRINKSVSAISSYESNAQMPPLDVLISIATVLNVSLDYLVDFSITPTYSTAGFTIQQKEVIELLFSEFTTPTQSSNYISPEQYQIIARLLYIFENHHSTSS
jgi:transcriptional regulator with XRE-family HTH domain